MAKPDRVSLRLSGERKPEEEIGFVGNNDEEEEDEDYDEDEDEDYDEDEDEDYVEEEEAEEPEPPKSRTRESQARVDLFKLENLARRMQSETVPLRVHDVVIMGNTKTKDFLIEAETAPLRDLNTMQDLLNAATIVSYRLQALEVFDSVKITLDSGPPELPGTSNVIVEVVETQSPLTGEFGAYSKGEAKSSTFEGSLKYKNLFGYGDLWDGSLVYGFDQSTEVSAGVYLPRVKGLSTPVTARLSLLNQDRLRFCSYKERLMGLSLGLFSTKYHDLVYNFSWRTLSDPSQMASRSIRRQLGHSLLSSLKYAFKIDWRNSPLRPTQGYAFVSTTQLVGIVPDSRSLRFLRQEFDFHYAVPLGFYRAAINFGISGGVVFPWGKGFLDMPSPLPEKFFLGGNLSPVCTLGGPSAFWGFRTRGLGPTEFRRQNIGNQNGENADIDVDYLGGDLAVTAFADLSFDLPLRWCREKGIHGHIFAAAGNVAKLTENAHRSFSFQKFAESFRSSSGVGLVVPTSFFRMELNYCYILKKLDLDRGKCGFQVFEFTFLLGIFTKFLGLALLIFLSQWNINSDPCSGRLEVLNPGRK